ncbi:hypothetical protein GALMADRAFT_222725 [Galerina marginata CBS 339.88]|uniref:DUF6570 domain-containing protein n=1 Tax=Galerina marginata (strain CBS 339.88) TaxID=685588 RepID=A0A067TFY7_GALM3|nr:hypothetical protein GALMADRAFT_222725 [Galerina marginata CBS 339.88]
MVAPLDVIKMNEVIPPTSNSIRDTMCAIFVGDRLPTRATISKYKPILVRKSRVKTMIQFLLGFNNHYHQSESFRFSEENLNRYIPPNDATDAATSDYTLRNMDGTISADEEDELLMENVGFTDGDDSPANYHTVKSVALERCLQGKPFIVSATDIK